MENGASYQDKVDYCKGLPQDPMSRAKFEEKYRGLAMAVADKDRTEEILKVVYGLEKQKDISTLISLLSESRQT